MQAHARKRQTRAQLFISKRMHIFGSYDVRAWITMNDKIMVNTYIDSLSFTFYDDPFIGCREIAETR